MSETSQKSNSVTYRTLLDTYPTAAANGDASWLQNLRQASYARYQTIGLPTRRIDTWKHIPLDSILSGTVRVAGEAEPSSSLTEQELAGYLLLGDEQHRLVFVNGKFAEHLSLINHLPKEVHLSSLSRAIDSTNELPHYLASDLKNETNAFALSNTFHFKDGVYLWIKKNRSVDIPIHLLFVQTDDKHAPTTSHPRLVLALEEGAKAQVIFDHVSLGNPNHLMNTVTEIHLGNHAKLHWLDVERNTPRVFHFHNLRAHLKEGARFDGISFTQGGAITRRESRILFRGENASCHLKGLTVLDQNSESYHHVTMNHEVPACLSRQIFKNILAGNAKAESDSLVYVHPNAQKSDSNQLIRNLLLSDKCRSFARPRLEIHADDVKATHGAATGQLSEEELFYLKSRGLNEQAARFVLTYGFAEEILEHIEFPSIRGHIEAAVHQAIEKIIREKQS